MGERTTITTPDGSFSAYVARPGSPKAPAVVVIQEIFGVNAGVREIADGLAGQGYLAIAPDIFWRIAPGIELTDKTEAEWKRAFELYGAFDKDKGVEDIAATIDKIRADPGCTGKVGVVGFCLGGLMAFLTATRTDVDAAISYYGGGTDQYLGEAAKLARPLMIHLAEDDEYIDKQAQVAIARGLKDHPFVELFSYPGVMHAFARPDGQHHDEASAMKAGGRSLTFFQKHLS